MATNFTNLAVVGGVLALGTYVLAKNPDFLNFNKEQDEQTKAEKREERTNTTVDKTSPDTSTGNWDQDIDLPPSVRPSEVNPEKTNISVTDETTGDMTTYQVDNDVLSWWERWNLNMGWWNTDNDTLSTSPWEGTKNFIGNGLSSISNLMPFNLGLSSIPKAITKTVRSVITEEPTKAEVRTAKVGSGGSSRKSYTQYVKPITSQEKDDSFDRARTIGSSKFIELARKRLT